MEYRKFNNTLVVRLQRGEEILTELKNVALMENIKLAKVSAIGATDYFVVGAYSVEEQNLSGNITTMNGEYYAHLHITCADEKSNCYGGHLNECRIAATLELFIDVIDGTVDRIKDEETGLNIFKF